MRGLKILKLLFKAFRQQSLLRQILFVFLITLLSAWVLFYFTAYCIWWVIKLLLSEVVLRGLEWYLVRYEMIDEADIDLPSNANQSSPSV